MFLAAGAGTTLSAGGGEPLSCADGTQSGPGDRTAPAPPRPACRRRSWLAVLARAWPGCAGSSRAAGLAVLAPGRWLAAGCAPGSSSWLAAMRGRAGRCAVPRARCAPAWPLCWPSAPLCAWPSAPLCAWPLASLCAWPLAPLCGRAWHAPGNLCDHRCGPVARWAGECLAVRSQGRSGAYSDARACTRPGAAGRRCTRLCGPHGAQGPLHGAGRCEALRGRFTGPAAARRSGAATGAPGGRCGRGWAAAGLAPGARLAPPCRCARPGQAMEDAGRAAAGCRRGAIRAHAAHTPCMHAYPGAGAPGRAEQVLRGRMLAGRMQRYWGACAAAPPHAVPALDMRMRCQR